MSESRQIVVRYDVNVIIASDPFDLFSVLVVYYVCLRKIPKIYH